MMIFSRLLPQGVAAGLALLSAVATAQTFSSCNPLVSSGCSPDTALGMAIDVDFTKGAVNSFAASGGAPSYGADGVTFTVAKSGDAPQLTSLFYIMFGRVEFTMKCAPGAGIVSSLVLQSDDLDEIDMEWLGADDSEVQTNYFGKGQTGSYNRGQFNPAANNQAQFITYTVDWTADRIVWSVGGTVVRTLAFADAAGQYPQTPMQVKFGAWSGGDPSNAPGTIQWARGPTDYSKGPFSMVVRSVAITDYSTGKQYKYGDTSGSWQSIQAVGGQVNGNAGGAAVPTATATAAAATSLSPSVPAGGIGKGSSTTTTQTGWPWVASSSSASSDSIPSGWIMTPSGKIVPASSTASPLTSCSSPPSSSSPAGSGGNNNPPGTDAGVKTTLTTFNGQGFLTTMTVPADWTRAYNDQGFLTVLSSSAPASAAEATAAPPMAAADSPSSDDSSSSSGSNGLLSAKTTNAAAAAGIFSAGGAPRAAAAAALALVLVTACSLAV